MKNIAIVSDSSIALTDKQIEEYGVYLVPNVIMHNEETYFDQVTITNKEIEDLLEANETVTTSQPIIGNIIEFFEGLKDKNYDHIIVFTLSSHLSGGFNAFNQAVNQSGIKNVTVIDSKGLTGPVQNAVKLVRSMNKDDKSIEEIINAVNIIFDNQASYLVPLTLKQIIASGRLSKTAGKIATMLKIKIVLYFKKDSEKVERLAVARTDNRIFDAIIDDFKASNVNPTTHDVYILESPRSNNSKKFIDYLNENLGEFNIIKTSLPASLSVHIGNGAFVIQWCLKV